MRSFGLVLAYLITFVLFDPLSAQSDIVQKGENGFEAGYSHSFIRGKDINGAYVGCSLDGYIDLNAAFAFAASNSVVGIGGAIHIGGKPNKVGLSFNGAVILQKDYNYLVFGPTIYAYLDGEGAVIIPNLSFQFASFDEVGFTGILGVRVFTKGRVAFSFSPQFVFNDFGPFSNLNIGILFK